MAEGKDTPTTPKQQKDPDKRPPWWKRLWRWTAFAKKSGWNWLELLLVPLVLVGIGLLFEMQQAERENQRAAAERELAEQRAQDEALQAYLDQMSSLLLEKDLRESKVDSEVRTLARARTLTVLASLDGSRERSVVQFLYESGLVTRYSVVLDLSSADLSSAALINADLRGADLDSANLDGALLDSARLGGPPYLRDAADLSNADLRGATLSSADLRGANLSDATTVTEEQLKKQTEFLEGATMPDGSKHP